MGMRVQVLVSAMNKDPLSLISRMRIASDAVIINQCDKEESCVYELDGRQIKCFSYAERGVGKSRNHALDEADKDICLFSDEDIVYEEGYEKAIIEEFEKNPRADMLVFNVAVEKERQTYHITQRSRVRFYNCGRYGAVSFAFRTAKLKKSGVRFSLLFGGGAKYSNGEDSLLIKEFMQKGYRVYTAPVLIGRETPGASSWFDGYHDKFFFDRGVLYAFLYGALALPMSLRFLLAHKSLLCRDKTVAEAFSVMRRGIRQGRREKGKA